MHEEHTEVNEELEATNQEETVESMEAAANEVTCTSRGNPGFPASTRERPRETFFNPSRGQSPLPWLGSNDALPLATRMETRIPWRPTRG